jgi:hypothetical protein
MLQDQRTDTMDVQRIKELLIALRDSCYEGVDGSWDCSTDEGKESFIPMADSCEEIASLLEIELPEYVNEDEDEDEFLPPS